MKSVSSVLPYIVPSVRSKDTRGVLVDQDHERIKTQKHRLETLSMDGLCSLKQITKETQQMM